MSVTYAFHSLEDFLAANPLTVDGQLDDGWGASFPVKGREVEATVLFADITGFSERTARLDPTETLTFVNHFFSWISAEALRGRPAIVDKYIGDEVMVVFSKEFGSDDPFLDAVQTARWMGEKDAFSFVPHIGIASGEVIVGFVGTPIKYDCSVFGAPVALAARCAGIEAETAVSSYMTFPSEEWADRKLDEVIEPLKYPLPDGSEYEQPHGWKLLPPKRVELKNLGSTEVRQIANMAMYVPSQSAEDRAREGVENIVKAGRRWHRPGGPKVSTK